jgi:hypothetical protein
MNEKKEVVAFVGNFRYQGILVSEEKLTYTINDRKEGIIKLPKAFTVLKVMDDDE